MRSWWTLMMSVALLSSEQPRTPVLVELFTSEGCSSCPPADRLLRHLQKAQPVSGAEVITLSEHVDYWDRLGWADPFSSSSISDRQRQYAKILRGDVYTPQMVVDGKTGFVGSDSQKALRTIAEAARTTKTTIRLRCAANPPMLAVRIDNVPPGEADVVLAIAESGLQTDVTRGENRGRLMAHAGVARRMTTIGQVNKQKPFESESKLMIDKNWKRENLSAVVFLQDRTSHRILGVNQIAISGCGAG